MVQMHADAAETVGAQRAVRAPGFVVRMEHEVVDDQLSAAGEQSGERLFAVGTVELVDLRDALPRQAALQAAHLVALARERLLLLEQLAPGGQPLLVRDDWMIPR